MSGVEEVALASALAGSAAAAPAAAAGTAAAAGAAGAAGAGALGAGASAGMLGAGATGAGAGMLAGDAALAGYGAGLAGEGAGMLGAGAGAGAGAGGVTAAQSASFNALGGELANPAIWQTATANVGDAAAGTQTGGMLQSVPSATQFVSTPVTQQGMLGATGDVSGSLSGTEFGYGSNADLAKLSAVDTAPAPGMLAQGMSYAGKAGKAASAYSTVTDAVSKGEQPNTPPKGRPIFEGAPPPIAQPVAVSQSPINLQSTGTAGDMLRGIAKQRLRKPF